MDFIKLSTDTMREAFQQGAEKISKSLDSKEYTFSTKQEQGQKPLTNDRKVFGIHTAKIVGEENMRSPHATDITP